jgi:hypothetical protein
MPAHPLAPASAPLGPATGVPELASGAPGSASSPPRTGGAARQRPAARALLALSCAALLAGCAGNEANSSTPNAGPCPSARVLWDAARLVEIRDNNQRYENVGFTGEVRKVTGLCRYVADQPIVMKIDIDFGFGRGPAAAGVTHNYRYFVAVTRRDLAVVSREYFDFPVEFRRGEDRLSGRQTISEIVIPRASDQISGANFEILVGFDLTPEQLQFNREGRRFLITPQG